MASFALLAAPLAGPAGGAVEGTVSDAARTITDTGPSRRPTGETGKAPRSPHRDGMVSNMSTNEAMARLDAAVTALRDVDVAAWSDEALQERLAELSTALCALDAALSRVADGIRARGLRIEEPVSA